MAQVPTAEDFFNGGGVKSAQFGKQQKGMSPVPGTVEHGLIVEQPETMQKRKYAPGKADDGALLFWDEEKTQPQYQLVVKIQTEHRDDEDDDGVRAIYIFGQLKAEVQKALKAVGAKKLEIGGHLYVKFVKQIINDNSFRQNIWEAKYEKPEPVAQNDFWGPQDEPMTPQAPSSAPGETMLAKLKRQGDGTRERLGLNANDSRSDSFDDEVPF